VRFLFLIAVIRNITEIKALLFTEMAVRYERYETNCMLNSFRLCILSLIDVNYAV